MTFVRNLGKTNCLTHIPQDIKVELNNGVLTLKAGSKVYVPNGFEEDGVTPKFDVVVIESDLSIAFSNIYNYDPIFVCLKSDGTALDLFKVGSACLSGTSPVTYSFYYRTDLNKLYDYEGDINNPYAQVSLPLGLFKWEGSKGITEVYQIFNGFSYIGSTVFALPSVKGLIPNGWYVDGSLKNIEFTNDSIKTAQVSGTYNLNFALATSGIGVYYYAYDKDKNAIYRTDTGAHYPSDRFIAGDIVIENGKVKSLTPKPIGGKNRTRALKVIKGSIANWTSYINTSTPGTYTVTIPEESLARVVCVGGGGAAAMRGQYDDKGYGWSGGSGGAFSGMFQLPAGTYTVVVGSANNNTSGQGGNTATLNPSDTSTHDSYITGVVRSGGGGSGHYSSNYVGAAGAAPVLEIAPLKTYANTAGNAGASGSGGKGSAAAAVINGGASVYQGYGQGQGCATSEYAAKRYWINGSNGYVKIEAVPVKDYEQRSKTYKSVMSATVELKPFPETATLSTTVSLGKVKGKTVKTVKGASIVCTGSAEGWDSVTVRKKVIGDSTIDIPLKKTLFESSTAGTYTLNIAEEGFLEMQFVGAGGGGTCSSWSSGDGGGADGGSGGYSRYVNIPVAPGSYTVKVGAGGARALTYEWGDVTGGTGGESSITIGDTKYYAGGGTGSRSWGAGSWTVGKGGWGNVSNGNNGQGRTGYNRSGIDTPSVYGGYGMGGAGCATNPGGGLTGWCHNGYSGYAKIVFRLAKA